MLNLAVLTGPQDISQFNAVINALILNLNASAPGMLNAQVGSVGNAADTTDDTTFSYIFAIGAWSAFAVGAGIRVKAWGTSAANGNNKTWKLIFGATTAISSGVVTINAKSWTAEATILRSGVSTQKIIGAAQSDATVIAASAQDGAESELANITMKITNASPTTGAAADLLTKGFTIEALR